MTRVDRYDPGLQAASHLSCTHHLSSKRDPQVARWKGAAEHSKRYDLGYNRVARMPLLEEKGWNCQAARWSGPLPRAPAQEHPGVRRGSGAWGGKQVLHARDVHLQLERLGAPFASVARGAFFPLLLLFAFLLLVGNETLVVGTGHLDVRVSLLNGGTCQAWQVEPLAGPLEVGASGVRGSANSLWGNPLKTAMRAIFGMSCRCLFRSGFREQSGSDWFREAVG